MTVVIPGQPVRAEPGYGPANLEIPGSMLRIARDDDQLRPLWADDGPTDPQQWLAAVDHPFEAARHLRHEAGKALRQVRRRRADGVGGAPQHHATGLGEFGRSLPRR